MKVVVYETVPDDISNSLNYTRIKHELHNHINNFCREKRELKYRLNVLRMAVGRPYAEDDLRDTIDDLKELFNEKETNVGLDYNIVYTKLDFVVTVHVIIKRSDIETKKFVFRYKKKSTIDKSNSHVKDNTETNTATFAQKERPVKTKDFKEALKEAVESKNKSFKKPILENNLTKDLVKPDNNRSNIYTSKKENTVSLFESSNNKKKYRKTKDELNDKYLSKNIGISLKKKGGKR